MTMKKIVLLFLLYSLPIVMNAYDDYDFKIDGIYYKKVT